MASFIVLPGTQNSILFSSSLCLRSDAFGQRVPKTSCLAARPQQKVFRPMIKAMGGVAKFKGTHMRETFLTEMIEKKVTEAKEVCKGDETTDECKVAWDEVEEVSQAKAHLRVRMEKQDPLESFCQENPETDECRIYED